MIKKIDLIFKVGPIAEKKLYNNNTLQQQPTKFSWKLNINYKFNEVMEFE